MADGYGGSSPWGMLGNLQRPNTQMMQYGMQMMQPRPPGQPMPLPPFSAAQDEQPQEQPPAPGGKRRVRIGNKTYVEEDDTAAAPSTQIGARSY